MQSTRCTVCSTDVLHLENEVVQLRREKDSLNVEVWTMYMLSTLSNTQQLLEWMCDVRWADVRGWGAQYLSDGCSPVVGFGSDEIYRRSCSAVHQLRAICAYVQQWSDNDYTVTLYRRQSREIPGCVLKAAGRRNSIVSMCKTSNDLKKSIVDKEDDYIHLWERFKKASANWMQAGGARRQAGRARRES
jgi:hypothetical protein